MAVISSTGLVATQREVLEQLLVLTDQQERALHAGDLAALTQLSVERTAVVATVAESVPPHTAWEPELASLAAEVKGRSQTLQEAIQQRMAAVRQQLVALNERSRMVQYIAAPVAPSQVSRWQA